MTAYENLAGLRRYVGESWEYGVSYVPHGGAKLPYATFSRDTVMRVPSATKAFSIWGSLLP